MEEISLEQKIAEIQKQRLNLQLQEEALLEKFREEELLKNKAADKVIARVLKILTENNITRSQLLTALDKDSRYAEVKVTAEAGAVVEATDAVVKIEAKAPRATIGVDDKRLKVLPKYENPLNSAEKWSGRGIPPSWAKQFVADKTLATILIPKTTDI